MAGRAATSTTLSRSRAIASSTRATWLIQICRTRARDGRSSASGTITLLPGSRYTVGANVGIRDGRPTGLDDGSNVCFVGLPEGCAVAVMAATATAPRTGSLPLPISAKRIASLMSAVLSLSLSALRTSLDANSPPSTSYTK